MLFNVKLFVQYVLLLINNKTRLKSSDLSCSLDLDIIWKSHY